MKTTWFIFEVQNKRQDTLSIFKFKANRHTLTNRGNQKLYILPRGLSLDSSLQHAVPWAMLKSKNLQKYCCLVWGWFLLFFVYFLIIKEKKERHFDYELQTIFTAIWGSAALIWTGSIVSSLGSCFGSLVPSAMKWEEANF